MIFRLTTITYALLSISSSVVMAQDPCATEDAALDMCLQRAGASEILKDSCDSCLEGIKASFALSTACEEADAEACEGFASCDCSGCVAEALAKGECEIDAERASDGIACPVIMCDGSASGGESPSGPGDIIAGTNSTDSEDGEFLDDNDTFSIDSNDIFEPLDDPTLTVTMAALDSAGSGLGVKTILIAGALIAATFA